MSGLSRGLDALREVAPEVFDRGCNPRIEGGNSHCEHAGQHRGGTIRYCCMCRVWTLPTPLRWEGDDS